MIWFWVVVLCALIGAIAVVAAGRGDAMAEVYDDRPDAELPTGRPLTADDLREVRLNTGVRGYRMDEVDALLARLEADLLEREERGDVQRMRGSDAGAAFGSDDTAVLNLIRREPGSPDERREGAAEPATGPGDGGEGPADEDLPRATEPRDPA